MSTCLTTAIRGGETGHTEFALPSGPNQALVFFFPNINGTIQSSPLLLSNTITEPYPARTIIPSLGRRQSPDSEWWGAGTAGVSVFLTEP